MEDNKEDLTDRLRKQSDELFSNQKLAKIFQKMLSEKNLPLVNIPFYLYDKKGDQSVTLWNSGHESFSVSIAQLKTEDSILFESIDTINSSNRGKLLEDFLALEFITNMLLVSNSGGYTENGNPKLAFDAYVKLGASNKVKLLEQYGLLSQEKINAYKRLNRFRNMLAHQYSVSTLQSKYLKANDGSKQYFNDFLAVKKALRQKYLKTQPVVEDYLLKVILK